MAHVFLSYCRSDRVICRRFRQDLRESGVDVWADDRLDLGGQWLVEISNAISESLAMILLASPSSLTSKWVMREVYAAQELNIPVIPVLAAGARFSDLPASLAGVNGVDFADGYDESVNRVARYAATIQRRHPGTHMISTRPRSLVLLTADESLAAVVVEICRPLGLLVYRDNRTDDPGPSPVAEAHIAIVDGDTRKHVFAAGYVAGRGGWVIVPRRKPAPDIILMSGIFIAPRRTSDLERYICTTAFMPLRPSQ